MNSFGHSYKITSFGESHGAGIGVIIDGFPGNQEFDLDFIQSALDRRRPGQSQLSTPRQEADKVEVLSGVEKGKTLGSPIALWVANKDQKPSDYAFSGFRPSHADFTTQIKYGIRSQSGGGRASARETIARVAAGALAESYLKKIWPEFTCVGFVSQVYTIVADWQSLGRLDRKKVDAHPSRCPDPMAARLIEELILNAGGDTYGGKIRCHIHGVPAGLGEPVFDKLEADLAKAVMSLPACKAFGIGSGYDCINLKGSEHNDDFYFDNEKQRVMTTTNNSGGIQGGISNGMPIEFEAVFKPTSSIKLSQNSVNEQNEAVELEVKGRHDPCVLPRAVPMVEAMGLICLMDHHLRSKPLPKTYSNLPT
jgi:chorismate synthase